MYDETYSKFFSYINDAIELTGFKAFDELGRDEQELIAHTAYLIAPDNFKLDILLDCGGLGAFAASLFIKENVGLLKKHVLDHTLREVEYFWENNLDSLREEEEANRRVQHEEQVFETNQFYEGRH